MKIAVRESCLNDYISIGNLIKNELGYRSLDFDQLYYRFKILLSEANHKIFVAICDGIVVGYIDLVKGISLRIEGEYQQIVSIAVKTEYQHMGIGMKLIQKVEDYARNNNIHSIYLTSNLCRSSDHSCFEQNGFRKIGYNFLRQL